MMLFVGRLDEMGMGGPKIRVVEGGARSPMWIQIKEDVTSNVVRVVLTSEPTSLEAAMLAGLDSGTFVDGEDTVAGVAELAPEPIQPQSDLVGAQDLTPKHYRSGDLPGLVADSLASSLGVRSVVVSTPGHNVHADEETLTKAIRDCEGVACLVSVGPGTVADIGKVLAATHGSEYVVVQTANSVKGLADDRSVLLVNGLKRTTVSKCADALIADTDVIVDAPLSELLPEGFYLHEPKGLSRYEEEPE
jgi:glycerol-1-phosphate dehydrogenase [NAD(P)+]